jgi:hypothetical protein
MNISFDRTSSFFTTSPCTFVSPAMPYLRRDKKFKHKQKHKKKLEGVKAVTRFLLSTHSCAIPAFLTAELMALTAV